LSIATRIFPETLFVEQAALSVPEGAQTPIAADVTFASPAAEGPLTCSLDWRRSEDEEWTVAVRTAKGTELLLSDGGVRLSIDGEERTAGGPGEYPDIYRRFVDLIDQRRSDIDVRPLEMVADCLLVGTTESVGPPPR
jgi:hypothetical protein